MIFVDTCILIDYSKDKIDISEEIKRVYDLPLWTHNKKNFRFLDIELY
jgi:predicted nucleic acid-binding protein